MKKAAKVAATEQPSGVHVRYGIQPDLKGGQSVFLIFAQPLQSLIMAPEAAERFALNILEQVALARAITSSRVTFPGAPKGKKRP